MKRLTEAHKLAISRGHLGKKKGPLSDEWKANLSKSQKGIPKGPFTEEHKRNIGLAGIGRVVTQETREKISTTSKGRKLSLETRKKQSTYRKGRRPYKITIKTRKRMSLSHSGNKNINWQGGISELHKTERQIAMNKYEYRIWRVAVFMRDNYTCVTCGKVGGNLNADHIKPFSTHPKLRLSIDNGRTLCQPCHQMTETYGGRINNLFIRKE